MDAPRLFDNIQQHHKNNCNNCNNIIRGERNGLIGALSEYRHAAEIDSKSPFNTPRKGFWWELLEGSSAWVQSLLKGSRGKN